MAGMPSRADATIASWSKVYHCRDGPGSSTLVPRRKSKPWRAALRGMRLNSLPLDVTGKVSLLVLGLLPPRSRKAEPRLETDLIPGRVLILQVRRVITAVITR